jgi:hypothetical protein
MISLAVLSKTRAELTLESLRVQLDKLYPGLFLPPQDRKNFVANGVIADVQFLIQASVPGSAGLYMLHNIAGGEREFSDFADDIDDPSQREAILQQEAWLSIHLVEAAPDQDCRRFIARVLAELAPADAAFLADLDRRLAIRFDEKVRGQLAREEIPDGLRRL